MKSIPLIEKNKVDKRQVAKFGIPFYFLILFIVILISSGSVLRGVDLFFFTMMCCIILTPFFFPVINFVFFQHLNLYHQFILTIMGLKGDDLSLQICFCVAVFYTVICYVFLCATIITSIYDAYEIEIKRRSVEKALFIISKISLKKSKKFS